jgi:hypothetical protein
MDTGTVQYSTVQYSTVQYSTVQYSTVQYSTVHRMPKDDKNQGVDIFSKNLAATSKF